MPNNPLRPLAFALAISLASLATIAHAEQHQTLVGQQVGEKISVISVDGFKFHTFHGISNSHIIETANELRLIDTQMIFPMAKGVKKYIAGLGKPLKQVILSHNHPDHWFGAEIFAGDAPIATSANVMADLKSGGTRYIKIMQKNPKMKGITPTEVIKPTEEIALGKQTWDGLEVIVEEIADQEAHHSLLIKIPAYGIMIGQDLFYNRFFLVASERSRNKNWQKVLASLQANEAKTYKTLLVGHGKNGGPDILAQDIEYLKALEATMEKGLSKEETKKSMIAQFPKKGGRGMLGISMRNLFAGH
jgi:hypothetical protein